MPVVAVLVTVYGCTVDMCTVAKWLSIDVVILIANNGDDGDGGVGG
jgi:hypothetical protein